MNGRDERRCDGAGPHAAGREARSPRKGWRAILPLGIMLLVAAAVRIALLAPIRVNYDEAVYLSILEGWADGAGPPGWDHFALRWGYLAPAIACVRLLGLSPATVVAVPFAFSLGLVAVCYALGALVAGRRSALVAAGLAAFFPLAVLQAGQPNTDTVLAFWLGAAGCLLLLALRAETRRAAACTAFASGLLGGVAYLTKVSAAFFPLLAVAGALRAGRRRWKAAALPAVAAFALVVAAEAAAYGIAFGDPLMRLHALRESRHSVVLARAAEQSGVYQGGSLARRLFLDYWLTSLDVTDMPRTLPAGLYFWLGFPAVLWALRRRRRALAFPLLWFIGFSLFADFFPTGFRPYGTFGFLRVRYFAPLLVPMFAISGAFLVAWARSRAGPAVGAVVLAVLLEGLCANGVLAADARRAAEVERALARFLAARPDGPVYASRGDRTMLSYWTAMRIRDRLRPYGYEVTADRRDLEFRDIEPGGLVVVNRVDRIFWPGGHAYPFGETIPGGWTAVWTRAPRARRSLRAVALGAGDPGDRLVEGRRITVYRVDR